jgi:hypothetical protein
MRKKGARPKELDNGIKECQNKNNNKKKNHVDRDG